MPGAKQPTAPFVLFEGGDGSGKSTQARLLYRRLLRAGVSTVLTRDPGGTPPGRMLERWLKQSPDVLPHNELMLFGASRSLLTERVIRPALLAGMVVVCDRYAPSSIAYQGYGRSLDLKIVESVNQLATKGIRPDIVFFLDLPPAKGLSRKDCALADRFQEEDLAFHNRVRRGYLAMAAADPATWTVLDATLPPRTLSRMVWKQVQHLLEQAAIAAHPPGTGK